MAEKSKYVPRLKERYNAQVVAALTESLGIKTPWKFRGLKKSLSTWVLARR